VGFILLLPACRKADPSPAPAAPEAETVSVTRWTARTELFMEYQPLVTTAKRRFAIHLTDLASFQPVSQGTVTVRLQGRNGSLESFTAQAPARPGIFGADVQPKNPGVYAMTVTLEGPGIRDAHNLGEVTVYSSEKDIPADSTPGEELIAFLKEQQWALDFATETAAKRAMRESLLAPGVVRPRSGGEVEVTAPVSGRVTVSGGLPAIGAAVTRGQPLVAIIPLTPAVGDGPSLELAVSEAKTGLDLARRDLARAERLLAVGAIPQKRVDEARTLALIAEARLTAADKSQAQYQASRRAEGSGGGDSSFAVNSPISGTVAEVATTSGATVMQGDKMFRLVAVDRVYVAAQVPESQAAMLGRVTGAEILVPGWVQPIAAARVVAKGSVVDPQSRTLSVLFEAPNQDQVLAVGQSVSVRLFLDRRVDAVAVRESAIVDDDGRPVVFVQREGEGFARRPVTLGVREANLVQISNGLREGERVVTRGAFLIRLASLSNQVPAHGHVH
jgi:RND family efflux transporter MFP subunit